MDDGMTRRQLLQKGASAGLALGLAIGPFPGRVLGANDRVRVGIVGPGDRGSDLMREFFANCKELNMELVASCDLWNRRREEGANAIEQTTGQAAIQCRNLEEICDRKDIDALIIATADFQHAKHLEYAIKAGKDVYVEKPLANNLEHLKAARKAVEASDRIVQVGTQRRSEGHWPAAAEFIASGALGTISYVEQAWNYFGSRWRRGDVASQITAADTDWKRWLLDKPYRPFDPHIYREFRLYWPFSSGIPCQWLSHTIDAIQWILGDAYPSSAIAHGGVYVWKDGRQNADTFQVLFEYPAGHMVSFSTRFGNDENSLGPIVYGTNGILDVPSLVASGNGGGGAVTIEPGPDGVGVCKIDRSTKIKEKVQLKPHQGMSHMRNWMECVRSRKQTNAPFAAGWSHSIPVIMAIMSLHTGRRTYYNPRTETVSFVRPVGV